MANSAGQRLLLGRLLADRVEEFAPGRRQRVAVARRELRRFAAGDQLRVLDAGCEFGALSLPLAAAEPDWLVHGVDLREEAVERARAAAGERHLLNVTFSVVDLTEHWDGEQYDAVACLECLVEIPDQEAAVRSLAAATRPGGVLLLQVPTKDWKPLFGFSDAFWRREARHGYSAVEVTELLRAAGFVQIEVRPTFRVVARAAQELRDRWKRRSLKAQVALLPGFAAAAWLDGHGVTAGAPRAWWVKARRA